VVKKIAFVLLVLVYVVSFSACDSGKSDKKGIEKTQTGDIDSSGSEEDNLVADKVQQETVASARTMSVIEESENVILPQDECHSPLLSLSKTSKVDKKKL
jgi:hypothetical protein